MCLGIWAICSVTTAWRRITQSVARDTLVGRATAQGRRSHCAGGDRIAGAGAGIGDVDLLCQLGSPRSIATFLQRAVRSGHKVGGTPKARLFPQTRDELVECAALLDSIRRGEVDALRSPLAPVDVLAQQIVAEAACEDWDEDALFALVRRAWPFAGLRRATFDSVVRMLCDGFSTRLGPRAGCGTSAPA